MPEAASWDRRILDSIRTGAVTFAWDDGEIRTIEAPPETLDAMKSAWEWVEAKLKDLTAERGRPRSVCFRLAGGEFRGLRFPDWNPGMMEDEEAAE